MLRTESGAVLPVSLIVLLVLTLIVMTSNQSTLVQEKLSSALTRSHTNLSLAEMAVAEAESIIQRLHSVSDINHMKGMYSEHELIGDLFDETSWSHAQEIKITLSDNSFATSQYMVQYLGLSDSPRVNGVMLTPYGEGAEKPRHIFKVIGRSLGFAHSSKRIVITHFSKIF